MKFLLRTLIGLAVSALIVVLIGYFLRDANRFKPEIQAFIEERTGVHVDITGDLSWRFFPPLGISAAGVLTEYEGSRYELGELVLDVSFMSVVRSRDINQWEILALTLDDLLIAQGEERTEIDFFRLQNFKPATPSPFTASLTQTPADGDPLPLTLDGLIAIDPSARTATLTDTRFETTQASGVCNLDAAYRDGAQPPDPEGAIIPVSIWRTVDWSGSCLLDRLSGVRARRSLHRSLVEALAGGVERERGVPPRGASLGVAGAAGGSAGAHRGVPNGGVTLPRPVSWRVPSDPGGTAGRTRRREVRDRG